MIALMGQHGSKTIYKSAFPCAGNACDAQSNSLSRIRENGVQNLMGNVLMCRQCAFDKGNRLGDRPPVLVQDALDISQGLG